VIRHDGHPVAALCGVSHIWVAGEQRRSGIASRLLDAVRYTPTLYAQQLYPPITPPRKSQQPNVTTGTASSTSERIT